MKGKTIGNILTSFFPSDDARSGKDSKMLRSGLWREENGLGYCTHRAMTVAFKMPKNLQPSLGCKHSQPRGQHFYIQDHHCNSTKVFAQVL